MSTSLEETQTDEEILEQFMREADAESVLPTDIFLAKTCALRALKQALKILDELSSLNPRDAG